MTAATTATAAGKPTSAANIATGQRGQRLDARYRDNRYYVSDYRRHGLRAPPRGYRWQRVDDSYILAAVATGLIASVIIANH
jgi:Ni/Co efflux regulator RcnB